jgi:hypothetical protein
MEQLKEMVTEDLSFDYREDELSFHFEECPDGRFLLVGLHDVEPGEIEDLV